jgi:hypothetical protein
MNATDVHCRDDRGALDRPALDAAWVRAAAALGFRVVRSADAYASSDGAGTITIGARETLDDDDSVAQLVFHELCHAVVQGEAALVLPDWGLDNTTDADVVREHACLRVQATWAAAWGLRFALAPTTVTKPYYLALPHDPLAPTDDAAPIARTALDGTLAARFRPAVDEALTATARALLGDVDCRTCGACCRNAFDSVAIAMRDPIAWRHPELVVRSGPRFSIARAGDRCAALDERAEAPEGRWWCRVYEARPRTCDDFARGSAKCARARARLGIQV